MSDQILQNYSQWEQDYQQPAGELAMLYQGFSTNFDGKNSFIPDVGDDMHKIISSPEIANPTVSPGKPKRSRRSKGMPSQSTTFLNASITNFRSLVQQHTGCHNSATTSRRKGPITLCFASASACQEDSLMAISRQAHQFNHQYYP